MSDNIYYKLEKNRKPSLDQKLQVYSRSDYYPFHMPGHKRNAFDFPNPYSIDITEIDGFDNLHYAEGILKEAQERAADIYGAKETFYLVNGSTCGILSAISAAIPKRGTLVMSRNSHKSAYHAAYLRELETIYILPAMTKFGICGSIPPSHIAQALEDLPQANGVFITSPTYDGVVSDIRSIAEIVHTHNLPLIVDEAHGSHFMFSEKFPFSALECDADIVIQSLHKTLPCLTQASLLHVNSDRVDIDTLKRFLRIYQTSSPSYLLMASIDQCIRLMHDEGEQRMTQFTEHLDQFYKYAKKLHHFKVFDKTNCSSEDCYDWDYSKILISVGDTGITSQELYHTLLQTYHLQMEMSSGHYVTALTSIMDTYEGFKRLISALEDMERKIKPAAMHKEKSYLTAEDIYQLPKPRMSISYALDQPSEILPLKSSIGHISQEYISLYPPGIPLVAPGEILTGNILRTVSQCQSLGLSLIGMDDMETNHIKVVKV